MCAQDPSGSQTLSVWAENSLLLQVLCLWELCVCVCPSLLTKTQARPIPL